MGLLKQLATEASDEGLLDIIELCSEELSKRQRKQMMDEPEFSRNQVISFLKRSPIFDGLQGKNEELIQLFINNSK